METSLFQNYILDDTLDNKTPNGGYINDNYDDNYDDENYINDNNGNNDRNHHSDYNNDDNDNNFDNDNGDQTTVMFQAIQLTSNFTLLHTSTKVCLIYFSDDFRLNR